MTIAFLIILFAAADRFSGGGLGWKKTYPGRPVWYADLVLALALGLVLGPKMAWFALAWFAWREPSWSKFFGGDMDPRRGQYLGTFLRHGLSLFAVFAAWANGLDVVKALAVFVAFSLAATLFAIRLRQERTKGRDANAYIELARGAIYGLAFSYLVI